MNKKLLSIALVASLVLSAAGCGETENTITTDSSTTTISADDKEIAEATTTPASTEINTETEAEEITSWGIPYSEELNKKYTPYDGWEEKVTVDFTTGDTTETKFKDGNYVKLGGYNSLYGISCWELEDIFALEKEMSSNDDYVLINTINKEISDEDYKLIFEGDFVVPNCDTIMQAQGAFEHTLYKIYMYKPTYEDVLEQLRENGKLNNVTNSEAFTSTVVVDYRLQYLDDRAYTIVNEFNNDIPDWVSAGFLKVNSPVDAQITLRDSYQSSYLVFAVKANEPFVTKIASSYYCIDDINGVDFTREDGKVQVKLGLKFSIEDNTTFDTPYVLDLNPIVDNYGIQPVDISGMQDYSYIQ